MFKHKKTSHTNFMTDKEKKYVSFCLGKNIKRGLKHKDFSLFFNPIPLIPAKPLEDTRKKPEGQNINVDKKKIIKEILTKTLVKTHKKSRKTPRPMIQNENIEISQSLNFMIKLELLFDKLVAKMYGLNIDADSPSIGIEFIEDDFFYFLDFAKFFGFLTLLFQNYEDDALKKKILIFILRYSIKIKHHECFKEFLTRSSAYFPAIDEEDITETDFLNYFYFNISNLTLANEVLKVMPNHVEVFYKYLSNENLDLVFSLDNDLIAWEFLATFIRLLDDERKAVIVVLIREKVIETVEKNSQEHLSGLTMFLDAIGLEREDLL